MELGEAIFGLAALACFIVPVIYLQRRNMLEKKKFLKEFLQLAGQQQLTISANDFWNHSYAVGIDTNKDKLFFLKKQEGVDYKVLIDLTEVENCSLLNINRTINDSLVIDRLALGFTFRNPKLAEKTLEFYNKEETMAVNDEYQLVEKWTTLINAHLQAIKTKSRDLKPTGSSVIAA